MNGKVVVKNYDLQVADKMFVLGGKFDKTQTIVHLLVSTKNKLEVDLHFFVMRTQVIYFQN